MNINSNSNKTSTNNFYQSKTNAKNDELNIELYLNKPVQIGCIQIKLKFNKEIDCPLELTLLNPNSSLGHSSNPKNIDAIVDFNLPTAKQDALFGPVDVREFLDLTCTKTYKITICSSKLFESRSNLFFLNLKLKNNKKSSDDFDSKLLNCNINFLQKVQITIRKYKKLATIPNENIERSAMLSQFDFFKNLLDLMSSSTQTSDTNMHLKLLDILNWVLYNNFSYETESSMSSLKDEFVKHLDKYLLNYYLYGNRSTSRKATILLNFLINRLNDASKAFSELLLDKLLCLLNYLPVFESSASMNWLFMLMHQVMSCDLSKTYDHCIKILTLLSKGHKYNPLYALLKMRYNFSCLIFESRLFDVDLYLKFDLTNQKLAQPTQFQQNFISNGNNYNFSFGTVGMSANNSSNLNSNNANNPNQMFSSNGNGNASNQAGLAGASIGSSLGGGGDFNKDYISLMPQSVGLIEVLPLEFKSISSSNGTTVDKTSNKQDKSLYVLPDCFSQFGNEPQAESTSSDSKAHVDTSIFNSIFNFSPLQFLNVERLEPISRHHVVLDFGFSVAITDIMIPSCGELSSISVDTWTVKEQKDSKRLCVSTDINQNPVLLNDLEPPAVCRYLKITYVAHSANIVKAKIPIGHFFGFPLIFLNEQAAEQPASSASQTLVIQSYLSYLEKLNEDKKCHYFMALGKLRELLNEISFPSDNIGHLKMMQFNYNDTNNESSVRIKEAYNQCLDHQFQYNLNSKLIKRLRTSLGLGDYEAMGTRRIASISEVNKVDLEKIVDEMSQDKLRVSNSLLIKTLLSLTYKISNELKLQKQANEPVEQVKAELLLLQQHNKLNLEQACDLFTNLCIHGNLERECSLLLLRCCYNEPWWGEFISSCLRKFFVKQVKEVMSLNKVFITLNEICIKSLSGIQAEVLFKSLFGLVEEILRPLEKEDRCVEVTSLEWIFLFISRLISIIDKSRDINCRWEFLENIYLNQKSLTKPFPLRAKSKVKKKLIQTNKYFTWSKIKENRKNLDRYRKSLWKTDSFATSAQDNLSKLMLNKKIFLPHDISLRVGYLIGKLLVSANSYCSSDLFVLSCRILSSICCSTQPSISLCEIFEKNDLNQLILLNVSGEFNHGSVCWGSPWSQHALISLFMDTIENEKANVEQQQQFGSVEKASENQSKAAQNWPYNPQMSSFKAPSNSNAENSSNNLKKIEEIDEMSIEKNMSPSTVMDALKITGDIAKNFSQLSEMLSTQINELCQPSTSSSASNKQAETEAALNIANSKIDELPQTSATSSNDETKSNQKLLNDLVENIMNKKLEEIKHTLTKPIKKLNYLSSASLNFNTSSINKKLAQLQNQAGGPGLNFSSPNHHINSCYNFAYDLRLETSFYQTLEHNLFIKVCNQNEIINNSLSDPLPQGCAPNPTTTVVELNNEATTGLAQKSSIQLLQETIETIFEDISKVNIENLLTFWLTLSSSEADVLKEPFLCLKEPTADYLLDTLIDYPFMTVKLWYLSFKMLGSLIGYNKTLFSAKDTVYKFVYKFLSSNHELVGDECCNSLIDLLKKLSESSSSSETAHGEQESHFKKSLFGIICHSIDSDGCMRRAQGPIDAQVTFVEYLIAEDLVKCYEIESAANTDSDSDSDYEAMVSSYFDFLAKILQHHIYIYPRLSLKGVTSPRSCFSGVLTSLLFGASSSTNSKNLNDKIKSSFDLPVPSFSVYGSAPHGFNINSSGINANIYSSHASQQASSIESKQRFSMSSSSSQSVLCNRDMLICLLLKFGINLVSDVKLTTVSDGLVPGEEAKADAKSEQISEAPTATNSAVNGAKANKSNNEHSSEQENSEHFYEDDLLIQQLFLFELQSIEDNEACVDQISQENFSCDLDAEFESMPQQIGAVDSSFDDKDPNEPTCKPAAPSRSKQLSSKSSSAEANLKQKSLIKMLSNECLETLIESLALCQSSALAMVISNSGYPIELSLDDIQTPGDGLFLLLKSLTKEPLKLMEPLLSYLSKFKRLSEPLLWFCTSLFAHESVVRSFMERGGIEVISKGLAITTRQLLYSGPCVVSSLMNFIDTERQHMKAANNWDNNDSTEGFTNFAPFGSIICTNPSGNPVDVLLQNSAPHRRIRSAIWSYNFQPNEHKVGLFLTFPYAFLLKEVQILPHTVSFGNCPAYVSLEVSRDGSFMIPIAPPVFTMGMSSIKLQLNKSELVNTVQINFYKSKDSHMIGLSQIRLLGYPMFENMLSAKPDMMLTPVEDLVSRSNMGWLRLLYTCLTAVPSLENFVSDRIQDATMLLCTRLLSSPAMIIYDKIIETILIKLSKYNSQRSLEITKHLLRAEIGYNSGLYSIPHGILMETLVNILYQISENSFKDAQVEAERIDSIVLWLSECFGQRCQSWVIIQIFSLQLNSRFFLIRIRIFDFAIRITICFQLVN